MRRFRPFVLALLLAGAGVLCPPLRADTKEPANVIAVQVHGTVSVVHGKTAAPLAVKDNDALAAGDIVETAPLSSVVLVLPNGSVVSLRERSRLAITLVLQSPFAAPDLVVYDNLKPEPSTSSTSLELMFGELVAQVRKLVSGSDLAIKTPVGTATVKGTEFGITYSEDTAGEANYRLSTATGLVVFSLTGGKPVEAGMHRQVEVRAHVGKAGVKVHQVESRLLPEETRARIQSQNQTARREVNQTLQRAKALRNAPKPPEDRTVKPEPPGDAPREKKPEPARKPEPAKKPEKPRRPGGI